MKIEMKFNFTALAGDRDHNLPSVLFETELN